MLQVWRTSGRARCSPETPLGSHPKHLQLLEDHCSVSQSSYACLPAGAYSGSVILLAAQVCDIILCCTALYHTIACYTMPCHAMLCGASAYHEACSGVRPGMQYWNAEWAGKERGRDRHTNWREQRKGSARLLHSLASLSRSPYQRKGTKGRSGRKDRHQHW